MFWLLSVRGQNYAFTVNGVMALATGRNASSLDRPFKSEATLGTDV